MSGRSIGFVLLAIALGCNGPFVVVPGGQLDGDVTSVPPDWGFAGDYGIGQLETRLGEPYSVNIAYTAMDGRIYINAGDTETQWAQNIAANPDVRLRLDGLLYELRAERVDDPAEIAVFGKAWTDQSMFRRDLAGLGEVWLYRLVSR